MEHMMKLTKAEADLLLPTGTTEFAGTVDELMEQTTQTYWAIDDAPWPYWERQKQMGVLSSLAIKHGYVIS